MIGIALSVVFVVFIFTLFDFSELGSVWNELQPLWLIPAFAAYTAFYVFSALRFRVFFQTLGKKQPVRLVHLLPVIAIHNLFVTVVPFRAGELSFLYLLRKQFKIQENLVNLLLARLADAWWLLFFFFLSGIILFQEYNLEAYVSQVGWENLIFFMLGFIGVVLTFIVLEWRWNVLSFVWNQLRRFSIIERVHIMIKGMIEAFRSFWVARKTGLVLIFLYTGLAFFAIFIGNLCFYLTVNVYFTIWQIMLISSFMTLISVLPIHGIAGLGTTDLINISILMLFGIPQSLCLPVTAITRVEVFVFYLLAGLIGYLVYKVMNRTGQSLQE
jgi:glycosyltransferase 2 family protein